MRQMQRASRLASQSLLTLAIAASVALLLTAGAGADPPPERVLHVDFETRLDYIDPALGYFAPTWQLEQATCAKLLNYPDLPGPAGAVLQPEVATGMPTVSADGLTYTFTVRDDFFFSPPSGEQVKPAHFKYALERVLSPVMASGGQPFFEDIVGAQEMINGQASTLSGVVASGQTLTITLTQRSGDFLTRLAMNFACPLPLSTPKPPDGIPAPVPSAGPYYIAAYDQNAFTGLVLPNPNYGGTRPRRFDEIRYRFNRTLSQIRTDIEAGTTDFGPVPPAAHEELDTLYGPGSAAAALGYQQWFLTPVTAVRFLAMNHDRPLFGTGGPLGNINLKKAVNYAIDRTAIAAQYGYKAAILNDQYLSPAMPGYQSASIYPNTPDLATAQTLAGWHPGDPTKTAVMYTCNTPVCISVAQIVQSNLAAIGLDVQIQSFPRAVQFVRAGTRGEPFDLTLEGWSVDYIDPYDALFTLDGSLLKPANNVNFAYFNDPDFIGKLHATNAMTGSARLAALGALAVETARDKAPLAAFLTDHNRQLFARRIGCQDFEPQNFGSVNLAVLCIRPESAVGDATATEGASKASFTISLASDETDPVTVNYTTANGSATGGQDYVAKSGSVTFSPHEHTKIVDVDLLDDGAFEGTESFSLLISQATRGTIVDTTGVATISDNDSPPPPGPPPPGPQPPPPPGPQPQPPPPVSPQPVRLPQASTASTSTVSAAGVASLSIACKGSVACRGAAELFANAPAGTAKALAKVRIGSTRFTIPARKTKVVKITLSKRGKQLLRKTRRLRVQLVLTLASSNGPRKISRNLTLVAAKRRN